MEAFTAGNGGGVGAWTPLCDLPLPVHGLAAASLHAVLYAAGGRARHRYLDELLVSWRLWVS